MHAPRLRHALLTSGPRAAQARVPECGDIGAAAFQPRTGLPFRRTLRAARPAYAGARVSRPTAAARSGFHVPSRSTFHSSRTSTPGSRSAAPSSVSRISYHERVHLSSGLMLASGRERVGRQAFTDRDDPESADQGSLVVLILLPRRDHVRRFDVVRVPRLIRGFFRADALRAARSGSFLLPVSRFHSSNVSFEIFPSTRS